MTRGTTDDPGDPPCMAVFVPSCLQMLKQKILVRLMMGIHHRMWEILALAWGCHGRWLAQVQVGTNELVSARTNPVALGGLPAEYQ